MFLKCNETIFFPVLLLKLSLDLGMHVGWEKATDEPMFIGSGERQPTKGSQRISTDLDYIKNRLRGVEPVNLF